MTSESALLSAALGPRRPNRRSGPRVPLAVAGAIAAIGLAAVLWTGLGDGDGFRDEGALIDTIGLDTAHLRWPFTLLVLALALIHYVATACAARAAVGTTLPLPELTLVQFAAAAANRLTPAGLGGSAVNIRYFTRRGVDGPSAVGAVAALAVLGAVADLLVLLGLVLAGRWFGLGNGSAALALLRSRLGRAGAVLYSPLIVVAVLAVAVLALVVVWRAGRRRHRGIRWTNVIRPIRELARHPARLAVLLAASASTTLVLAVAFAASVAMVPGSGPDLSPAALLVAFMAGAAAGNAVPTPAGIGSAELAFVAVLTAARVPAARAIEVVLLFRLLTFWLPAALGLLAARRLRGRQAL